MVVDDKMIITMNIEIKDNNVGKRVDSLVSEILKEQSLTRSIVQKYIEKGCTVNDKECKRSYKLKEGDILSIDEKYWYTIKHNLDLSKEILPQKGNLDIRYEDENIIVLYKPKGLVVHPGVGNREGTLANYLRYYLDSKQIYDTLMDRCGIVHRLDKGVSGLMVVAKNKENQEYLKTQFQDNLVIKIYKAQLDESKNIEQNLNINKYLKELSIELQPWKEWEKVKGYIGRSSVNRYKMEFRRYEFVGSKHALSYVKFFGNDALIKIETGRMHQIRSTLEYLGYHIKGDSVYGKNIENSNNIMLESVLLSFEDINKKRLTFTV